MAKPSSLPTWNTALHLYETTLLAAGRSPNTVRLYRHYLRQLQAAHERSPWTVTTTELRELMATPGWDSSARKSCRTALRGFYGWALGEGHVREDPAAPLLPVTVHRGVPKPAPEPAVAQAVGSSDARIALIGMLAAFLALRVGEIAPVHERDVIPLLGTVGLVVHGKGGKMRILPVEDRVLAQMLTELEGYAFPNVHAGGHITAGHVSRIMSRALPGRWTAHTLRHRCATVGLAETGNIYAVSEFLGHSRLETTQIYALLPSAALRAVSAATSHVGPLPPRAA